MIKQKTIRPMFKRVAVELDTPEKVSEGGIHIPTNAEEVPEWGTVLAVAPDCEIITEPGTRVFVSKHQGTSLDGRIVLVEESKIKAKMVA